MKRTRVVTGCIIVGTLLVSGCAVSASVVPKDQRELSVNESDVVATNIDDQATVRPGTRIHVSSSGSWTLLRVSINDEVQSVEKAARTWSSAPLPPKTPTIMRATLTNSDTGIEHTIVRKTVTTGSPDSFEVSLTPRGGTYGVGMIPRAQFSSPIAHSDRDRVTQRLSVTTAPTALAGSWRWISNTEAAFRPATFWTPHTKVTVTANMKGLGIRTTEGKRTYWGLKNDRTSFTVGRALVVTINGKRMSGTVSIDGKQVRRFGVSLGKSGFLTRSGIKTLTEKYRLRRMTNLGVTDDEVYDLQVPYAMRITDSGEFLHAAPWNGNIGYANTSHGCSNLKTADAKFIFDRMLPGDPVITTKTGRPMETWNGPGALWNIPAARWAG